MADDEVTDLTDDEESESEGSRAKGKKPKAPKEPKEPKEKKQKAPKEKSNKKSGAGGIILIMILVLIILIGGFGAALYFDMFSSRTIIADIVNDPLLQVVVWLDPRFTSVDQRLRSERDTQERRFSERSLELDEREDDIIELEDILSRREQILDRREADLDRREAEVLAMFERTIPLYRRDMTDEELDNLRSYSRTYAQMAPADAARILVEIYDQRDVAAILFYMSERARAAIMSEMTPSYAAAITEIWLYY